MTNREDYISKFNTLSQKFNSGQFPDMTSPAEIKELYTLIHELLIRQTEMEVFVEELKLAQFESELKRNKFEKLFRLAPIPYITIDKSGNILEMNAEAIKLLLSGNKSFNLLTSYLTADSKPIFSNFLETLDRSYEISSCDIEVRIFTSGKSFLKINGIRYEPDETTENIVYLISMIDVSKEKETEKRLRRITDNLKEINETKNRLLSVIAHDLRSPFHNLLGITEILLAHFHDYESEPTHKLLDGFEKIVKNQYNLVSNLLS